MVNSKWFLCPFEVQEGETGTPEVGVRLDELMQEPGDVLHYAYDYGDNLELRLVLQGSRVSGQAAPIASCVDGAQASPPEDAHRSSRGLLQLVGEAFPFDLGGVNKSLQRPNFAMLEAGVDPRLVKMLYSLQHFPPAERLVVGLLKARPLKPSISDEVDALEAWIWFLNHVGDDGLELTSAGYLKPDDVEAACERLPMAEDWYGKRNREINVAPLLQFREDLRIFGLVRKSKGRLLLTRLGRMIRNEPDQLWDLLADSLLPYHEDEFTEHCELLALTLAATSASVNSKQLVEILSALGWRRQDRRPLEIFDVPNPECLRTLENVKGSRPAGYLDRHLGPMAGELAWRALTMNQRRDRD